MSVASSIVSSPSLLSLPSLLLCRPLSPRVRRFFPERFALIIKGFLLARLLSVKFVSWDCARGITFMRGMFDSNLYA